MKAYIIGLSLFLGLNGFFAGDLLAQMPRPKVDKSNPSTKANAAPEETIYLENPSFEDIPRAGMQPAGWMDCGGLGETPPDVQPYGGFRVTRTPQHGNTYLGLVTRDNGTFEGVAQKLSRPMKAGVAYTFSLQLARSATYESATKKDMFKLYNFDKGVTVRVWAGSTPCDKGELIGQSELIDNTEWKQVEFKFTLTRKDYQFICIEAHYKTPTLLPYNGNLLVDNLSAITPVEKPVEVVAKVEPKVNPTPKPTVTTPSVKTDSPKVRPVVTPTVASVTDKGDFNTNIKTQDLKVGQTFRLQNLYFQADSTHVTRNSERTLNDLYAFLTKNPNIVIEIGGHTNGLPTDEYCDKLSTERAKFVSEFLQKKGVPEPQLQYKGYGKRKPIDTNETELGRSKNQRVEIKILEIK
jgi:outer membrane protein OmpA-like peptidoglycan-associated protein